MIESSHTNGAITTCATYLVTEIVLNCDAVYNSNADNWAKFYSFPAKNTLTVPKNSKVINRVCVKECCRIHNQTRWPVLCSPCIFEVIQIWNAFLIFNQVRAISRRMNQITELLGIWRDLRSSKYSPGSISIVWFVALLKQKHIFRNDWFQKRFALPEFG